MHILLYVHYYPPNGGAAASRNASLARYLAGLGHRVTVLTTVPHYPTGVVPPQFRGRLACRSHEDGVEVVRVWLSTARSQRILSKAFNQLSFSVASFLWGLRLPRADVAYVELQPFFTGAAARLYCRLRRIPFVQNVSDLWPDHLLSIGRLRENSLIYRWARWTVDRGFRFSAALTSMSPYWTQRLERYTGGQSHKIHTILRGTDIDRFRPGLDTTAFRQKYQLGDCLVVSFFGTLALQYDFDALLSVARRLETRGDVIFLLVGSGSQQAAVAQQAAGLRNLRFIEWLDHAEMPIAWNATAVNVWAMRPHPLYEGTIPAKLSEAMACGTPIAAAQGGAAADIIRQAGAGEVVAVGDAEALCQAVLRLLDNPSLRQQCASSARAYAEAHFDNAQVMARYADVILKAARPRSGA